jgi:hypothetical protein
VKRLKKGILADLAKKRIAGSISIDKGAKIRLFKDKKAFKAILAFLKRTKIGLRLNWEELELEN